MQFIDLNAQRDRLRESVDAAIARVLDHGAFIMGPEVEELERSLAAFAGVKHAVSCASGTDALLLALLALDVRAGDGVIVPSFTFAATAEVVALIGAIPIFADSDRADGNVSASTVDAAAAVACARGIPVRAVMPVDLYGNPAAIDGISAVADDIGAAIVCDAAQSFGAELAGRRIGGFGVMTTTSFFPAKPLGCYGDGGAILLDDDELRGVLRSLRVHGQGSHKYDTVRVGINGRLDTIQAAVLLEKLAIFEEELDRRQQVAAAYKERLGDIVRTLDVTDDARSAWAQFTIVVDDRDAVADGLREAGVPTAVYYPVPLHRQPAYAGRPTAEDMSASEWLAGHVLSLPMHPYLDVDDIDRVVTALEGTLKTSASGADAARDA